MNFNKNPFELMSVPASITNNKLFNSKIQLTPTETKKNLIIELTTNPKKRMEYELSTFHNPKYNIIITDENFKKFIIYLLDDNKFIETLELNHLHYIFKLYKNYKNQDFFIILKNIEKDIWGIHDLAVLYEKISYYYKDKKVKSNLYKLKAIKHWTKLFKDNELLKKTYTFNLYQDEFTKKNLLKNWDNIKMQIMESLISFSEKKIKQEDFEQGFEYFNQLENFRNDYKNKEYLKTAEKKFIKILLETIKSLIQNYKNNEIEIINKLNLITDSISKKNINNKIHLYKKLLTEYNNLFEKLTKNKTEITFPLNKLNKFFYLFNYMVKTCRNNSIELLDESTLKLYLLIEKKVNQGFNIISTSEAFNNISPIYICKNKYLYYFDYEKIRLRLIRNYVSKLYDNETIKLQIVSFLENVSSKLFDRNYTLAIIAESFLIKGDLNNSLYVFKLIPNNFILSGNFRVKSYIYDIELRIKLRDLYYSDYNDFDFNLLNKIYKVLSEMPKHIIIFDNVSIEEYLEYLKKKNTSFYFIYILLFISIALIIVYVMYNIF